MKNNLQNDLNRFSLDNVLRLCLKHDLDGLDVLIYNRLILKEYAINGGNYVQTNK